MTDLSSKTYSGKLLLFGEYTVLHGSAAIAIPLKNKYGKWAYDKYASQQGLRKLKSYLHGLYAKGEVDDIDFDLLERDMTRGIHFDSSIPTGYGAGSSGAVVAAFYDRYVQKNRTTLVELKKKLGLIESCFHGSSSGTDPLVSYINEPLLIHPDGDIELLGGRDRSHLLDSVYIIDSGLPRETSPLVSAYKKTREQSEVFLQLTDALGNLANEAIVAYIEDNENLFTSTVKKLSQAQYECLPMLIPDDIAEMWSAGLESGAYSLKLCGAGGGGFFLAHVHDHSRSKGLLTRTGVTPLKL